MTLLLDAPDLTLRQARVLCAVAYLTATLGYPPSIREVMQEVGLGWPNAMRGEPGGHLPVLRRKGYLTWDGFHARTLRLTKPLQWKEVLE